MYTKDVGKGGWVGFVEYKILYRVKDSIARMKGGWVGKGWARGSIGLCN
jgi:hypothetical protein